jgi:hypothetical protein
MAEPVPKRAKRECSICNNSYRKLTDHLSKAHKLLTKEERDPYMQEAFKKTPDLRLISELHSHKPDSLLSVCRETRRRGREELC